MTDTPLSSRLDANWRAITVELDRPRASLVERTLVAFGVPRRFSRLIVATPALRRSWYLAIAIVVVVGMGALDAANARQSLFTLLLLAPLVPVLGVALAFGAAADPGHELTIATPLGGMRLLLVRTLTVLFVSVVVITPIALLGEVSRPMAAAWLIPAIAVTSASLAVMTALAPRRATAAVAVAWVVVVVVARWAAGDPLAAFGPIGQLVAALCVVGFGLVALMRRGRFDRLVAA